MILPILLWWLVATLLGLLALPLIWRLFDRLPDRGFGFARALGILVSGYFLWLAGSFQLIQNSLGGAVLACLPLGIASIWILRGHRDALAEWIRENRKLVIVQEVIFISAFVIWAVVRSYNPDIAGTEKPMEIAFLNAILQSDSFPPHDPWLSGYAISYYYLGYILLGLLTRLTGVLPSVAFNLANGLWFALVILGTYSILFNLISLYSRNVRNLIAPLLGPLFVVITGNLEVLLEILHSRHLFWVSSPTGGLVSNFWTWIGLENLENPPLVEPSWLPARHWWWWRASRVIRERDLSGIPIGNQPIDEFPFFSFLLADNHPHLLALPFVLLAIAFTLQIYQRGRSDGFRIGKMELPIRWSWGMVAMIVIGSLAIMLLLAGPSADQALSLGEALFSSFRNLLLIGFAITALTLFVLVISGTQPSLLDRGEFWFGAWLFGALAFLNTWDFPIYFTLLVVVIGWGARWLPWRVALQRVVLSSIAIVVAGVLLFIPWYPSFSSQAGGVLPHLFLPTRLLHFLIMFGVLLAPILVWLGYRLLKGVTGRELGRTLLIGVGLPLGLLLASWLLTVVVGVAQYQADPVGFGSLLQALGTVGVGEGISSSIWVRATQSWVALLLGLMIAAVVVMIWRSLPAQKSDETHPSRPDHYVLFLIAIGGLLVLGAEFFYLKDQFNVRMNTIFKFYFAAWILWGLTAGYATYAIWQKEGLRWKVLQVIILIPLGFGLLYPVLSVWNRSEGFQPSSGQTLDGTRFFGSYNAADLDAIHWIDDNLDVGVLAEAVGGSYTYFGRFSAHTGFPTVLGWPGHESQWRGGAAEQGSRESDIRELYQTTRWSRAREILDRYEIDYVILGLSERNAYSPVFQQKFEKYMDLIYENEEVMVFARSIKEES